jgi:hypothetical protein
MQKMRSAVFMPHDAKLAGDILLELKPAARESTATAMAAASQAIKLVQGGPAFEQFAGRISAGRARTRRRMVDLDQLKAVALSKIEKNHRRNRT